MFKALVFYLTKINHWLWWMFYTLSRFPRFGAGSPKCLECGCFDLRAESFCRNFCQARSYLDQGYVSVLGKYSYNEWLILKYPDSPVSHSMTTLKGHFALQSPWEDCDLCLHPFHSWTLSPAQLCSPHSPLGVISSNSHAKASWTQSACQGSDLEY